MNKILSKIENIDGMWQITKNINKSLSHFPTHIEISIPLQKLDSILNRTIGSKILNNLSIDIEKDLDLILR